MELPQAWFSDLETEGQGFLSTCDEMKELYHIVDSSTSGYSSEVNLKLVDQSFQTEIKPPYRQEKSSQNPEPLIATSSNTFTISFGNLNLENEADKLPDQSQDYHALAERKRRQKLNQLFSCLAALIPNLKKKDRASVLEDAISCIKQLQDRVKELEGNRKEVQECFIYTKRSRSRTINGDDEYSSLEENDSSESAPEIEVRISGNSVLARIQCRKQVSSLVNTLAHMQKLGLSIISSSCIPFAKTTIIITIAAQMEDNFCMTPKQLVKNLNKLYI